MRKNRNSDAFLDGLLSGFTAISYLFVPPPPIRPRRVSVEDAWAMVGETIQQQLDEAYVEVRETRSKVPGE